jgi:hypothetical protein
VGFRGPGFGRLVVLGHHAMSSGLASARQQPVELLQRLLVVMSRVPIRLGSNAHENYLL